MGIGCSSNRYAWHIVFYSKHYYLGHTAQQLGSNLDFNLGAGYGVSRYTLSKIAPYFPDFKNSTIPQVSI